MGRKPHLILSIDPPVVKTKFKIPMGQKLFIGLECGSNSRAQNPKFKSHYHQKEKMFLDTTTISLHPQHTWTHVQITCRDTHSQGEGMNEAFPPS
jgi:hypothetical protein